jgi:hypothetical protein
LNQVRSILDHTRHPRLTECADDHTYADKFAVAEFCTNAAVAAQMNALERLGLDGDKLRTVIGWVHDDKKSVTMRLEAKDACAFFKERDVEVVTGEREIETIVTNTTASSSPGFLSAMVSGPAPAPSPAKTETTKVKVVTKVKEYHWKVEVTHRLLIFAGADPSSRPLELQSRSTSAFIVTSGGQAHGGGIMPRVNNGRQPPTPVPESTVHPPIDVNLTWFFLQIEPKEQLCRFQIDRDSVKAQRTCRTPRRNDDVDGAFEFYQRLLDWSKVVQGYLLDWVEGRIAGSHSPAQRSGLASGSPDTVDVGSKGTIVGLQKEPTFNGKLVAIIEYSADQNRFRVEPADKASGLPSTLLIKPENLRLDHMSMGPKLVEVSTDPLFCPVLPLAENGAVFGDIGELLNEQCRSLDAALDTLTKQFPPKQLVKLVSVAEASLVLVSRHIEDLCTSYQDSMDYIENMLKQQLLKGKLRRRLMLGSVASSTDIRLTIPESHREGDRVARLRSIHGLSQRPAVWGRLRTRPLHLRSPPAGSLSVGDLYHRVHPPPQRARPHPRPTRPQRRRAQHVHAD